MHEIQVSISGKDTFSTRTIYFIAYLSIPMLCSCRGAEGTSYCHIQLGTYCNQIAHVVVLYVYH
jgi:hypothetical protein